MNDSAKTLFFLVLACAAYAGVDFGGHNRQITVLGSTVTLLATLHLAVLIIALRLAIRTIFDLYLRWPKNEGIKPWILANVTALSSEFAGRPGGGGLWGLMFFLLFSFGLTVVPGNIVLFLLPGNTKELRKSINVTNVEMTPIGGVHVDGGALMTGHHNLHNGTATLLGGLNTSFFKVVKSRDINPSQSLSAQFEVDVVVPLLPAISTYGGVGDALKIAVAEVYGNKAVRAKGKTRIELYSDRWPRGNAQKTFHSNRFELNITSIAFSQNKSEIELVSLVRRKTRTVKVVHTITMEFVRCDITYGHDHRCVMVIRNVSNCRAAAGVMPERASGKNTLLDPVIDNLWSSTYGSRLTTLSSERNIRTVKAVMAATTASFVIRPATEGNDFGSDMPLITAKWFTRRMNMYPSNAYRIFVFVFTGLMFIVLGASAVYRPWFEGTVIQFGTILSTEANSQPWGSLPSWAWSKLPPDLKALMDERVVIGIERVFTNGVQQTALGKNVAHIVLQPFSWFTTDRFRNFPPWEKGSDRRRERIGLSRATYDMTEELIGAPVPLPDLNSSRSTIRGEDSSSDASTSKEAGQ